MGRSGRKKKKSASTRPVRRGSSVASKGESDGTAVSIKKAQDLKNQGNANFQNKRYVEAMELYAKALKLVSPDHSESAFLHSNRAVCLMNIEPVDYKGVVEECSLALATSPHYKKARLRRAKAYEALGKVDMALQDVEALLQAEPNDMDALDIAQRLTTNVKEGEEEEEEGKKALDIAQRLTTNVKEGEEEEEEEGKKDNDAAAALEEVESRAVKLVYHDDIRLAQMPLNCRLSEVREIVRERYPSSRAVLIKYKDSEGDLVTITNTQELRLAEKVGDSSEYLRLYVVEVDPNQEPLFEDANYCKDDRVKMNGNGVKGGIAGSEVELDKWIYGFAQLFRTHLGIDPEAHMDLQIMGMEFCSEALGEAATSEDAQRLFQMAASKFQEIAAVALFNWGNVHMCTATKKIHLEENSSKEEIMTQLQAAYDWAQGEYTKAGQKYEEALRIKPDFYEGLLALARQHYESGRLGCSLALATNIELEEWDASETLHLFSIAEEKMQMGIEMWERLEEQHLQALKNPLPSIELSKKSSFSNGFKEEVLSADDVAESAVEMRSEINRFWGNMLFDHSDVEFKLGLPMWEEHLEAAVEKFKYAGTSPTDIAVLLKNHSSNAINQEGLGFKIDEIVRAWNEMCEAKRLRNKNTSFRLEPLFWRKVPRLHQILEHVPTMWHGMG
ncbi:hypothetical protein SUGI_0742440 [Cryptomeria japonica]|uniref:protein PHOX1 n=1 Tax=Cryptomeria japonica TaxID=3369 RepID=UPI0024149327|nr:protein PHOX1 [Cryptomeria japonica]GLJ36805.1 hypothetical protein SUGI_0742440 [Cryptomeria japonica]